MSVRFYKAAGINLGSDGALGMGEGKATLAFRVQINWPPDGGGHDQTYMHSAIFDLATANADTGHGKLNFYHNWWPSVGGSPSATVALAVNVVNHVVITYDKDDASKQAIYVNGQKFAMSTNSSAFAADRATNMRIGQFAETGAADIDIDFEGVLWLCGYAVDQAEVYELKNNADPTTFGLSASQRSYWPLTGTQGATVGASDVGITNTLQPSFPSTLYLGTTTTGSALTYGAAMPWVPLVSTGDFAVYSSGEFVRIAFTTLATGKAITMAGGSIVADPTITINGGSPITLIDPLYTSNYAAVLYRIPPGHTVVEGDSVLITTAENWCQTASGFVGGVTDAVVDNRAGRPVYSDKYPPTLRVGHNNSYSVADWHSEHGIRNAATRTQITYGLFSQRDDQTVSQVIARPVYSPLQAGGLPHLEYNTTGDPVRWGKYALGYKDKNPSQPTVITLRSSDGLHFDGCTELTAYRNDVTSGGSTWRYRVYEVGAATWSVTLAAAISDTTTTTITVADATKIQNAQYAQSIKVGSEYMFVMGKTGSTITVIRGAYGTTPATHSNGATGQLDCVQEFYALSISFDNPTTSEPDYDTLVLYQPGDWDVPETPGPVTLDTSEAYRKAPGAHSRLAMSNGVGVLRHMDSTDGGFGRSLEVEHTRKDDDLWPGENYNYNIHAKIVSSETATVASAPYMYVPYFLQNAVKYDVTLAADIADAPAAGTIQTIQITEDSANPVFFGQRIEMPSGEVVRVLTQSGNAVSVERGCERTTPATQAAGTVQARWRVPVPNDAAWQTPDEARIIQTCDANHGLWSHVLGLYGSNDLNPLARINVTLTEDIPQHIAQNLPTVFGDPYCDFAISVDAADAQYVVKGLYLVFDEEAFLVQGYVPSTSTTGRIYAQRAYCGWSPGRPIYEQGIVQQAHTSGTVAVGSSGGVYCQSADGTKFCWSDQSGYNSSIIVTGPKSFVSSQGGMDSHDIPGQIWHQVGTQTRVPIVDDASARVITAGPDSVFSWEQSARITAYAPGADHWMCIPQYASNDLVDYIATKVRDNLPAGQHRVLVELGNELWNQGTPRLKWSGEMGQVCGYGATCDELVYRGWSVFKRVQAVFEDAGRGSEVKFLMAWQQFYLSVYINRAIALGLGADVDVVSTAPYFLPFSEANLNAAYDAATNEEAADIWKFDFEYNYGTICASALATDGQARRDFEAAAGRSVEYICYEGGPDSFTPVPAANIADGYTRNLDINYTPNMWNAVYDFPYMCHRVGGADGIAYFDLIQLPSWNPSYSYYQLWGMSQYDGQVPGRGDGTDGKADNQLCLVQPGQPNTKPGWVNQDATNVSVRFGAYLTYQAAYAAYSPDSGEPSPQSGCVFFMGF
jgi:hypothetical protein